MKTTVFFPKGIPFSLGCLCVVMLIHIFSNYTSEILFLNCYYIIFTVITRQN
jgi:hypothetical protein